MSLSKQVNNITAIWDLDSIPATILLKDVFFLFQHHNNIPVLQCSYRRDVCNWTIPDRGSNVSLSHYRAQCNAAIEHAASNNF